MNCRKFATWAELLELKAIWIVTTILLGDVVALFALDTGHSDLRADIRALACHGRAPFYLVLLICFTGCAKMKATSSPEVPLNRHHW